MHLVFSIKHLKKCVCDPPSIVPLETLVVKNSLTYVEVQVEILIKKFERLSKEQVSLVKVLWRRQFVK